MKQKLLEMIKLLFGFIMIIYFWLVLQKPKRAPKPLLGRQNCVTSTGGRHNLVPGLNSYRRGRRGLSYTVYSVQTKKALHLLALFFYIPVALNGKLYIFL